MYLLGFLSLAAFSETSLVFSEGPFHFVLKKSLLFYTSLLGIPQAFRTFQQMCANNKSFQQICANFKTFQQMDADFKACQQMCANSKAFQQIAFPRLPSPASGGQWPRPAKNVKRQAAAEED